jgi:hypothetical protein
MKNKRRKGLGLNTHRIVLTINQQLEYKKEIPYKKWNY